MVYFDHNATTPPDPRVVDAMLPWLRNQHGNPSSVHAYGQAARGAVEEARDEVAQLLGVEPPEVVFTGSGTEANNAVLDSQFDSRSGHLVVTTLEHPSIAVGADRLEARGVQVTRVAPDHIGVVSADSVLEALRDDTRLVAVMLANNEIGTLQPVSDIALGCRERGIPVLCDAVQAVGKVEVEARTLDVDYLTLGGHKFHGPLGAAALWVRRGNELEPLLVGGAQERRRRAGTENVPALVGLGVACRLARTELDQRHSHLAALRDRFETGLESVEGALIHCQESPRLPNTTNVAFDGVEAQTLLIRMDLAGFALSTGSACASGSIEPSATLLALGLSEREALSSLRISFGLPNRPDEVDALLAQLVHELVALRAGAHALVAE